MSEAVTMRTIRHEPANRAGRWLAFGSIALAASIVASGSSAWAQSAGFDRRDFGRPEGRAPQPSGLREPPTVVPPPTSGVLPQTSGVGQAPTAVPQPSSGVSPPSLGVAPPAIGVSPPVIGVGRPIEERGRFSDDRGRDDRGAHDGRHRAPGDGRMPEVPAPGFGPAPQLPVQPARGFAPAPQGATRRGDGGGTRQDERRYAPRPDAPTVIQSPAAALPDR